jgi:hypothetical protein
MTRQRALRHTCALRTFCFAAAAKSYVIIKANRKRPCLVPRVGLLNLIMTVSSRSGQLRARVITSLQLAL